MNDKIAFIGLGEMGFGMALNLVKAGYQVFGFDVNQERCKEAENNGINVCKTISEAAKKCDHSLIILVRDYYQVKDVVFGTNGIVSSGRNDLKLLIMSTVSPFDLRSLEEQVKEYGYLLIDAPISGAKARADDGTLTIMTAGNEEALDQCDHYFNAMGKFVFNFGEKVGAAQAAKLSNNLILAINMIATTEGLKLAQSFDLPLDELISLLKVSSGNNWVVQNWDVVSKWWEEYKPGATLDIVHKDLLSILGICLKNKISLPAAGVTFSCLLESWGKQAHK